jgi:thiol-disulfide isomerase/thioredoxin
MKLKIKFSIFLCFISFAIAAQNDSCKLVKSSYSDLQTVDTEDIRCIAGNSENDITIFYTFAAWCSPCIKHLPDAYNFAKNQNADLYILLIDREWEAERIADAKKILDKYPDYNFKTVILSDSLYDKKLRNKKSPKFVLIDLNIQNRKKYENFIKEITPPQFESLDSMSKYIVLNKSAEVIFVSTYKDNINEKGKVDENLLLEKMKRFIENERND